MDGSGPTSLELTRAQDAAASRSAAQAAFDRLGTYSSDCEVLAELVSAAQVRCAAAMDAAATCVLGAGTMVRISARVVLPDGTARARVVDPTKGWLSAKLLSVRGVCAAPRAGRASSAAPRVVGLESGDSHVSNALAPAVLATSTAALPKSASRGSRGVAPRPRRLDPYEEYSRQHHEHTRHQTAPAAHTCPCDASDGFVTRFDVFRRLESRGIAVFEPGEAISVEDAMAMEADARALDAANALETTLQVMTNTRDDRICWLKEDDAPPALARAVRWQRGLAHALNERHGGWDGRRLTSPAAAMLACYPENAAGYRYHRDNDVRNGERSNPRALTCIIYLNPSWDARRDGGCLKFYDDKDSMRPKLGLRTPLTVSPEAGKVVIFDSFHGHEVLPSHRARYALTLWLFSEAKDA